MICPYCSSENSKVIDKRNNSETGHIRRRRECLNCDKRYTTYERIENIELDVIKRSGKVEQFDREKLKRGVIKAVKKRNINEEKFDDLIDDIERKLLQRKAKAIKSTDIGKMVLVRLKKIDKLGYLLFASVYKDFQNLNDFEKELRELKKNE